MNKVGRLFLCLSLFLGLLSLAGCAHYTKLLTVGTTAPDFTLRDQNGKLVSLKDYRGQWVIVYFYPKDFGRVATTGGDSFRRDEQKLAAMHTAVLGINRNDVYSHKDFATQEHLTFPLLSDEGSRVAEQYGSFHPTHLIFKYQIYSTFIVDPEGKIAQVFYDFYEADASGILLNAIKNLQSQTHP